jgi:hypothetical protein
MKFKGPSTSINQFLTLIVIFIFLGLNRSHATDSNFTGWLGAYFQGKFSNQFGWYFEDQIRLNSGVNYPSNTLNSQESRGNRLIIRPAIRWLPTEESSFQVFLGYGWTPNFSPDRNENRLWQQALYQSDEESWLWAQRVRFEQRWVEGTGGTSFRLRYLARLNRYFSQDKILGASIWDEVFWNFNSVSMGPQAGFDQNRVFLGPHIRLNSQTRFEFGYMNIFTSQGLAATSFVNHAFVTYVYIDGI